MAIYSLSHAAVGRTTHAEGTAGAHAGYITRDSAAREIVGEHMPTERQAARDWLNQQEAADRKNARVIDKVMLALPIELDAAERDAGRAGLDQAPDSVQEPCRETRQVARDNSPAKVAVIPEQATQRPSYAAEKAAEPVRTPKIAPERQREASRLRQAIDRARERLEALGNRLEQAFGRFREAWERKRQAELDPLEEARRRLSERRQPAAEPPRDATRSLFEDLSQGRRMKPPGWTP